MPFITRFSRLVRADAHAMLDQFEEPEALLKQAVRDMEEELTYTCERMHREEAQLEHLHYQVKEVKGLIERFDEEIIACFDAKKEDLTKNFIRRKLESEQFLYQVSSNIERKESLLEELQHRHQEQQAHYNSMRQKSELLWQDLQMKKGHTVPDNYSGILEDDVEIAFIKEKQRYSDQ